LPPQLEPETRQLIGYASDVMGLRFVIDSVERTFGEWAKRYAREPIINHLRVLGLGV
jgi:hypothetical protein